MTRDTSPLGWELEIVLWCGVGGVKKWLQELGLAAAGAGAGTD